MAAFNTRERFSLTRAEVAVFVSGVASMGLEILAGRIVAPQFGSSIYTWGTIIGVFLAALSLGYHRGGKQAAVNASNERLAVLMLGTAAYVAVLIFAGDLLLRSMAGYPLPSRLASLPAVTILFGPPTYLLGFISPYGAELSRKEDIGEASGHVYAVGTVGSILGAFGTTYFLIPTLTVDQIGLVFGLLLVGTALALTLPEMEWRPAVAVAGVTVLLVGAVVSGPAGIAVEGRIVHQTQTPYQELQVVDRGDTRTLYLDGHRHSAMDLDDPDRHVFDYTRYFHLPFLAADDPDDIDRVLFIGGGGFTGPKHFADEYDVTVDVVEIDPDVIDAGKEYFGVEESENLTIHNGDGRQFLRNTDETYDLIVLDAYKKDKVPFQMTTEEFMQLASDRLSPQGMFLANVISAPRGPASRFYRAEYKTMNRVFPQVYSFPTSGSIVVQNIEVLATKDETLLTEDELRERNERRDIGIDLRDEVGNYERSAETDDVPLLRDDHAPVDSLLDPMVGQRYVVEETPDDGEAADEDAEAAAG
ncbi:spermidine synthase [Halosolutus halophilus]|uniref:spermidine synthase n=1 Tax=Halosolutus halophilus TaxID=1552990 RepID=UPI002234FF70|nr:fused MFS/spermidine synthase [Halosolutus halophilus]